MGNFFYFFIAHLVLISSLATADSQPPQNSVTISGFEALGSGCPQGSVLHDISPDGQVITLIFSEYQLVKEGAKHAQGVHKSCRMKIQFEVPPGWAYAVNQLSVQGGVDLESGLAAVEQFTFWTGEDRRPQRIKPEIFRGPVVKDYSYTRKFNDDLRWSSCDKRKPQVHELVLDSTASIYPTCRNGRKALGVLTIDAMENLVTSVSKPKATFHSGLRWKRCR